MRDPRKIPRYTSPYSTELHDKSNASEAGRPNPTLLFQIIHFHFSGIQAKPNIGHIRW